MSSTRPRYSEPIRKPWIWVLLVLLLLAGVPWYLPTGMIHPVVLGVPLWALVVALCSVALAAHLSWVLSRHWHLLADEEADAAAPDRAETAEGQD